MEKKTLLGALLIASIAVGGCGGGGGGGGKAAPTNLSPDPAPGSGTGNGLNTGVFSDSPVAGLKYVQGTLEGLTDVNGNFQYDSNNPAEVNFYIGNVLIGSAKGAELLTPFDVNVEGFSTNRGINISRLLISLDVDSNPDNGIMLPDDIKNAAGSLPFDLQPALFDQNAEVQFFVKTFCNGPLVGVSAALVHLDQNQAAQSKLQQFTTLTNQISSLDVKLVDQLVEEGVIATLTTSNGEQLVLSSNSANKSALGSVLYVDSAKRFVMVSFDEMGAPRYVNINGVRKVVLRNMTVDNFGHLFEVMNYSSSSTPDKNYLIDISGTGNLSAPFHWGDIELAMANELMAKAGAGQIVVDDVLVFAGRVMNAVANTVCESQGVCWESMAMGPVIDRVQLDNEYRDKVLSNANVVFDVNNMCIGIALLDDGSVCAGNVSLVYAINNLATVLAQDLAVWNGGFVHVGNTYEGFPTTLSFYYSDYPPLYANSKKYFFGEVAPGPWLEAKAFFDMQYDFRKLPNGDFYYQQSVVAVKAPLTTVECKFIESGVSQEYKPAPCSSSTVSLAEHNAIKSVLDDFLRLVGNRRGFLYYNGKEEYKGTEYDEYIGSNLTPPYLVTDLQSMEEFSSKFAMELESSNLPYFLALAENPVYNGVEVDILGDTKYQNYHFGISHSASIGYEIDFGGVIRNQELRYGYGHVQLKAVINDVGLKGF